MSSVKTSQKLTQKGPSTFALLVDDIRNMSASAQKLLWIQLNKEKLSSFATEIDAHVTPNNLNTSEIDSLILEAKKNGRKVNYQATPSILGTHSL
jgi:hypothetical protein